MIRKFQTIDETAASTGKKSAWLRKMLIDGRLPAYIKVKDVTLTRAKYEEARSGGHIFIPYQADSIYCFEEYKKEHYRKLSVDEINHLLETDSARIEIMNEKETGYADVNGLISRQIASKESESFDINYINTSPNSYFIYSKTVNVNHADILIPVAAVDDLLNREKKKLGDGDSNTKIWLKDAIALFRSKNGKKLPKLKEFILYIQRPDIAKKLGIEIEVREDDDVIQWKYPNKPDRSKISIKSFYKLYANLVND